MLGLAELGHHIRDPAQVSVSNKSGVLRALGGLIDKLETKFGPSLYAKRKAMVAKTVVHSKPAATTASASSGPAPAKPVRDAKPLI